MKPQDRFLDQTHLGRLAAVLLAGLIGLTLLVGLVREAAAVPHAEDVPFGQGVLWQVERPGEDPSYLFGTIHLSRKDILAVPEAVKNALAQSRSASFEILFDDDTSQAWSRAAFASGRNTLDAVLGPELFAELVAATEPYGYNVHSLRHLRPWAVMLTFAKPPSVAEEEEDGKPILDQWLFEQAEQRGIPTYSLESLRQHVSPFADLSRENQRKLIRTMIQDLKVDQTELERRHAELVRRYLDGDIGGIIAGSRKDVPADYVALNDEVSTRLFDDRNHLMVERMLPRLKAGKAFVAIGAGHLPGDAGILSLLTEHGYQIRRVY